MHQAPTLLLCSLGLLAAAAAAEPPAPSSLSDRLAAEIRASLPRYEPKADQPGPAAEAPPDPDVILMPRMEIREKRLERTEPDDWLRRDALQRKIRTDYLASMDGLTGFLNSWSIPLVTPSVAARANARYRTQKTMAEFGRLSGIANALQGHDPKARDELRDEIQRALTGRPPARR